MAGEALPTVSTELFVIACLFAIITAAALYGCARVIGAFRLAPLLRMVPMLSERGKGGAMPPGNLVMREAEQAERSRAAAVASALAATSRRERGELALSLGGMPAATSRRLLFSASKESAYMTAPVGRAFTRRTHSRVSAVAARRDSGA
jgi:hypothetical protein